MNESNVQVNRFHAGASDAGGEERMPKLFLPLIERFGATRKNLQSVVARTKEDLVRTKYKDAWRKENEVSEAEAATIKKLEAEWNQKNEASSTYMAILKKAEADWKAEETKHLEKEAIWEKEQAAWRHKKHVRRDWFRQQAELKKQEDWYGRLLWEIRTAADEEFMRNMATFTRLKTDDITVDKYGKLLDLDSSTIEKYALKRISPEDLFEMRPEYRKYFYYKNFYEEGSEERVREFLALTYRPSEWR